MVEFELDLDMEESRKTVEFEPDFSYNSDYRKIYEDLTWKYNTGYDSSPFKGRTFADVFLCSMALGFKNKKFVPFKGKKSTGISASALKDRGQALVMSVAIAHEKSLDVLFDTAKVYSIAENYANGGLPYLLNIIVEKDNIGSPAVRMENELRLEINKIISKRSQSVEHAPDEVMKSPYEKIEDLESSLRKLISQKLEEVSKNWLNERLPPGILQEWKMRESNRSDKQLLKPNKIPLINYSHVGELKDIIIRKENVSDLFL